MQASEAVDLFLLPGNIPLYITRNERVLFSNLLNPYFSGLAFDKAGRRLGRGGGYLPIFNVFSISVILTY